VKRLLLSRWLRWLDHLNLTSFAVGAGVGALALLFGQAVGNWLAGWH
jgi:hypothetical protein